MKKKQISVIIPVYNMEASLSRCLDSVLSQTGVEYEVICIDDGSTDKSNYILNSYLDKYKEISVVHQNNCGSGIARNRGLEMAEGDFVAFMDADDYYPNHYVLKNLYEAALQNCVDICGGKVSDENGVLIDEYQYDIKREMLHEGKYLYREYQCPWGYWRFIFKLDFLKRNKIQFPDYLRGQDPVFFVKAMCMAKEFYIIDKETYIYTGQYKEVVWNERKILDYYKMAYDLLVISIEENLEDLKEKIVVNVFQWLYYTFYYFVINNKEMFTDILHKLNDIKSQIPRQNEVYCLFCIEEIEEFIHKLNDMRQNYKQQISKYEHIYIYGAGVYGKKCKHFVETEMQMAVEAFLVSDMENSSSEVLGVSVRSILDSLVMDGSVVLVAVKESVQQQLGRAAIKYGYKNIIYMDCEVLKYCECSRN